MKNKNLIALGLIGFLAFKYKSLFAKGGSSSSLPSDKPINTNSNVSSCGSFPYASELIKKANDYNYFKVSVIKLQVEANLFNYWRFGNSSKRIATDGFFGACSQKACLSAFPKNWESDWSSLREVSDRIEYINALLEGKTQEEMKRMITTI